MTQSCGNRAKSKVVGRFMLVFSLKIQAPGSGRKMPGEMAWHRRVSWCTNLALRTRVPRYTVIILSVAMSQVQSAVPRTRGQRDIAPIADKTTNLVRRGIAVQSPSFKCLRTEHLVCREILN